MPELLLRIDCPKCAHDEVWPYVISATVLTTKCPECGLIRSIEIASLPTEIRDRLAEAIQHETSHP